jgi:hypothetical protein
LTQHTLGSIIGSEGELGKALKASTNKLTQISPGSATMASSPTFASQYGPLIAALIALLGVIVSLTVNGRRDQDRYVNEREDVYRRDQRAAIASIAVAGHNFRRECAALVGADQWEIHREAANVAMATLLNELTVAKLLIYDEDLQAALDSVFKAWDAVCSAVDKLEDEHLGHGSSEADSARILTSKLNDFDTYSDVLHTITLEKLKPTVVKVQR